MATHTEPSGRHTKEELMHPGRDHHLKQEMACPDPSAHRDTRLQEQASTAALYVTSPGKRAEPKPDVLDKDGKLSSRSAAASLKHASAQDLPGFPVVGINSDSAGGAALLANANHKQFEHWKPDPSQSASAAAMLAKDYKMAPLWKPELSAAGSKAALLAHKDGGKLNLWMPSATAEGNSAATIAMKNKGLSPEIDYGYTPDGRNKALLAATGALGRSRSTSTPQPGVPKYPDAANSAHNALNAATVANRPSTRKANPDSNRLDSAAMEAARVRHIGANLPKEMWTEKPPVEIELEEQRHQAALRASSVSMAKSMYDYQQRQAEGQQMSPQKMGQAAAVMSQARSSTDTTTPDIKKQAMQYIHLQEAAHRLAEERLAKLDPDGAARYREHYGYGMQKPRNRLSIRGRARKRSGSEGAQADDSSDDEMTARRIRSQMQGLQKNIDTTDEQKRKTDRASLLAAAEKKVSAQMHSMDEKVFAETGKVSPAMMEEWEAKARAKANKESEQRMVNHGKTQIGGGRYMDQSEIEAIALARLKPTLDEINETAEKKRARDEEIRLDVEQRKRELDETRRREKETKYVEKRTQDEEKAAAKQEKAEQKAAAKREKDQKKTAAKIEKDAEKARRADEKRQAKESSRRSKEVRRETDTAPAAIGAGAGAAGAQAAATRPSIATDTPRKTEISENGVVQLSPTAELNRQVSAQSESGGELRPDLERHVTGFETSESELSSDEDEEEELEEEEREEQATGSVHVKTGETILPLDYYKGDKSTATDATPEAITTSAAETTPKVADTTSTPAAPQVTEPTSTPTAPRVHDFDQRKHDEQTEPKSPKTAESRGLKGLFSKLKRRSQPPPAKDTTTEKHTGTSNPSTTSTTTATATPSKFEPPTVPAEAIASAHGIENPGAASPSSFARHRGAADTSDVSSLESSGKEEEGVSSMLARGRKGKGPERLNLDRRGSDDEDDFEEARDTFDESLAPPPSFGGQAKSASPVRETKFQEEL